MLRRAWINPAGSHRAKSPGPVIRAKRHRFLDRSVLERRSCECCRIIAAEYERSIGSAAPKVE
jgi:hypothetical protein